MEKGSKQLTRMLTDAEYDQYVEAKDARKAAILETMKSVKEVLVRDGTVPKEGEETVEISPGWKDVNSFFSYETPEGKRTLHVRVIPIEDDISHLLISMRELDYEKMIEERKRTSTGDEHLAEVRKIKERTLIPNDLSFITQLIKAELPIPKVLA